MSAVIGIIAFSLAPLLVAAVLGEIQAGVGFSALVFMYLSFVTGQTIMIGIAILVLIIIALAVGRELTDMTIGGEN